MAYMVGAPDCISTMSDDLCDGYNHFQLFLNLFDKSGPQWNAIECLLCVLMNQKFAQGSNVNSGLLKMKIKASNPKHVAHS